MTRLKGLVSVLALFFGLIFAGHVSTYGQDRKSLADAPLLRSESGPMTNATVSFGAWKTPLNRFGVAPLPSDNEHRLWPEVAKIKAGGTVNFIISGLHVVAVYDDGVTPEDIDTSLLVPGPRPGPPIIDDPTGRIYFGIDPVVVPAAGPPVFILDRVEVVRFAEPGMYLVICAVLPHFNEGMYGYVRVLPKGTSGPMD